MIYYVQKIINDIIIFFEDIQNFCFYENDYYVKLYNGVD
jgi:GTP1/Obg family GTP-binding protein